MFLFCADRWLHYRSKPWRPWTAIATMVTELLVSLHVLAPAQSRKDHAQGTTDFLNCSLYVSLEK